MTITKTNLLSSGFKQYTKYKFYFLGENGSCGVPILDIDTQYLENSTFCKGNPYKNQVVALSGLKTMEQVKVLLEVLF